jgi:hypothetical protein
VLQPDRLQKALQDCSTHPQAIGAAAWSPPAPADPQLPWRRHGAETLTPTAGISGYIFTLHGNRGNHFGSVTIDFKHLPRI